ncbi:sensor histidine kinase YesM [Pedobacter sp. UYP30]|uniref:tetratricopeptide repeat-containing sensor histidine kinase n=1 Tax=Pedobacter sp. UYP30 TaxID=1756400 RepID=UPI0033908020
MNFLRFATIAGLWLIYSPAFSQLNYKSLLRLAQDSTKHQKYNVAIKLLFKAKSLKGKDTGYSDKVNMYLGNNYEALNKIDSSIFYYGEAVKFCEQKKDFAALSFLYSRLGNLESSVSGRQKNAINYFKKQLIYDKLLKDSTNLFDCLNNIGVSYKELNIPDSAIFYFDKVISNQSSYNNAKNNALLFTADTYSLQHRYKSALIFYDKALRNLTLANDTTGLFAAYANKGDCLMQQNKFNESIICLNKANQFINPNITDTYKAVLYHNFAFVYSKLKLFEKAFKFKNLENITKDNINTENIGDAIIEMAAKYELRKKQDSIYISKQALVLADAKTNEKQRNFIILVVVSVAIILFFISIYRFKQLKYKNSLQRKEAEQNALKLNYQYKLTESELKAIRSQMNPHFIFNVLNSIEAYIMENDKKTASRLLQKFAALSRLILENSTKSLVIADKELKALMLYTELEAMRYDNSFKYNFIVDDEINLKRLFLPPMLIQPLIENAILHGLITAQNPDANLKVQFSLVQNGICITIEDNGYGIEKQCALDTKSIIKEKSMGLASIIERIEIINKQESSYKASFNIAPRLGGGTIATICLPLFTEQ